MRDSLTATGLLARVALAAALAAGGCAKRSAAEAARVRPSHDDAAPVRVTARAAVARQQPEALALTGTLLAEQQSELAARVAGIVDAVLVERGAVVQQGQVLVRLRDVDYRTAAAAATAALEQARARLGLTDCARFDPERLSEVRAARANHELAEDMLRRTRALARDGAATAADLQRAEAQAAAAREQYNTARNGARAAYYAYRTAAAQAEQARRTVVDATVRAPFAGEVAERRVNVGEYVTPQRPLLVLVDADPVRLELQVPQEQIAAVAGGQRVEVRVDAYPDRTFEGTVRYVGAAVRQDTRTLPVEALLPNADRALRPGLFASARVLLGRHRTLTAVPAAALHSSGGGHRVFVVDNGRARERVVTVAERSDREALIASGVEPGERVVVQAQGRLVDAARVQE